jgi:hypothetical protein
MTHLTDKYPQIKPVKVIPVEGAGVPEKDIKTTGIKIRGTGAATKGLIARGPMA